MSKISIIIPFYNGNKYLSGLRKSLEEACKLFANKVEVILVNDSPNIQISRDAICSDIYDLKIIHHVINHGIHQARVSGLEAASGEYILFLDQDDRINCNFFVKMIGDLELDDSLCYTFSNGVFEDENGNSKPVLNSYGKVLGAMKYQTFLKVGNLLASPGQCLVRKSSIPTAWKTHIMKTNCADDFLLWILILKSGKVKFVNEILYEHVSTGENVSSNKIVGYKSYLEVCEIIRKLNILSTEELNKFSNRCESYYRKANSESYNRIDWFVAQFIEFVERLKMKMVGFLFHIVGKRIRY